jgi:hypothetical protein
VEHLERHVTFVPEIMGQKYGCHAATPKLTLDAVAIGEAAPELLG